MKIKLKKWSKRFGALALLLVLTAGSVMASEVSRISIDALRQDLGNQELVVLDVRQGRDWSASEFKIKGSVRADPQAFEKWSANYPKNQKLVLYCA